MDVTHIPIIRTPAESTLFPGSSPLSHPLSRPRGRVEDDPGNEVAAKSLAKVIFRGLNDVRLSDPQLYKFIGTKESFYI